MPIELKVQTSEQQNIDWKFLLVYIFRFLKVETEATRMKTEKIFIHILVIQ